MRQKITETVQIFRTALASGSSLRNVMWNVLGGGWAGLLILVVTPWYVHRLGLEGYGILSLWLMMQVMMGLLDSGMGATLARGLADSKRDHDGLEFKRDLLRTLEIVYCLIAALVAFTLALAAGWLGDHWLKLDQTMNASIGDTFRLMAIALGLQFPCALYQSGLSGLQEHKRMNTLQILGNSLRYGCGVGVLVWRVDLAYFFAVQALVAAVQTYTTRRVLWGLISEMGMRAPAFRVEILQGLWRFSTGMALSSMAAVLLANADRVLLSRIAPTEELGRYAVAFTATGLLQMAIQPFYRVFFPRYSELVSSGDAKRLRDEYFKSCQFLAVLIIPLGVIGWVFAPQLFNVWLGNHDKTLTAVFRWLLIGITCSGLMWLPAAFQQAHGWTRLHTAMMVGALVMGAPVMVWSIKTYGPVGATLVWVLHGISDITLGLWLMHRRLLFGELLGWYRLVLLPPLVISLPLVGLSWWLMPRSQNTWVDLCWIGVTGLAVIAATTFNLAGTRKDSASAGRGTLF